jgi:hypothetical protein
LNEKFGLPAEEFDKNKNIFIELVLPRRLIIDNSVTDSYAYVTDLGDRAFITLMRGVLGQKPNDTDVRIFLQNDAIKLLFGYTDSYT